MARVTTGEALRFMIDCLKAAGADPEPAKQQAELLMQADQIGCPSHGLHKLESCVKDIQSGAIQPNNRCSVEKESASTALVDAKNVLGATSSHFAMDLAIAKAKKTGIGLVTVRGGNYIGILGYWAKKAADMGYIGMAFCNASPVVVPPRSKTRAIGSNPLSLVAPARYGDMFYLDMSSSVVSIERIELLHQRHAPIPLGWALGPTGAPTTDSGMAMEGTALLPLGTSELTSSHKGFGLAGAVEILSGLLAGSKYAHQIHGYGETRVGVAGAANLGHCFIAIDPGRFAPGFRDRLYDCITYWRKLEPIDPSKPVLAPGDKEKAICNAIYWRGYVTYHNSQVKAAKQLADRLRVRPMTVKSDDIRV